MTRSNARCLTCGARGVVWSLMPTYVRTLPRAYAKLLGWAFFSSADDGAIVCVACGGYDVERSEDTKR